MIDVIEWLKEPLQIRQAHLKLDEQCIERGGHSDQHRGVLAEHLNTTIPSGYMVNLCHACNNGKCSNPKHLYWGTAKENTQDCLRINGRRSTKGKPHVMRGKQYGRRFNITPEDRESRRQRARNLHARLAKLADAAPSEGVT